MPPLWCKGHKVNDYPDLTDAQRKKFWDDQNTANQANTATPESKKGNVNVVIAVEKDATPAADDASKIQFEQFQRFWLPLRNWECNFSTSVLQLITVLIYCPVWHPGVFQEHW